jgi:gluconokinase
MLVLVMGVSGSGKSTIARALAARLGWEFADADDFHPPSNIAKMSQGIALTDADRQPWLLELRKQMNAWRQAQISAVLACSALKASYRQTLGCGIASDMALVYLKGSFEQIYSRLQQRANHFMSADLLRSQFVALEEPTTACIVRIEQPIARIVDHIIEYIAITA